MIWGVAYCNYVEVAERVAEGEVMHMLTVTCLWPEFGAALAVDAGSMLTLMVIFQ